ncbi:unnamed protein product, partial [marine sediment metagenome]
VSGWDEIIDSNGWTVYRGAFLTSKPFFSSERFYDESGDVSHVLIETEWWETVRPEDPQFVITVFHKGARYRPPWGEWSSSPPSFAFTITRVVLEGIEVWTGQLTVEPFSRADLIIPNIEEVFELEIRNNLLEVYIENSVNPPGYFHNVIIRPDRSNEDVYPDGHSTVWGAIGITGVPGGYYRCIRSSPNMERYDHVWSIRGIYSHKIQVRDGIYQYSITVFTNPPTVIP